MNDNITFLEKITNHDNNRIAMKIMIVSFFAAFFLWLGYSQVGAAPVIRVENRDMFPETWRCPYCGYENYEGISSCAVCGK